ncbi:MAG: hypothetical protein JXB10_19125 [Pirellulales bacterium]|nr:hypothetical protein [Pirellulales bacterium]
MRQHPGPKTLETRIQRKRRSIKNFLLQQLFEIMTSHQLPIIEIFGAMMFHCPKCQVPNYRREINYEVAPDAKLPGTEIPLGGTVAFPPNWHVCDSCGYTLTDLQKKHARPFDNGGGITLPAWFYTCDSCGQDNFVSITIYYGDGVDGPPRNVKCNHCNTEFNTKYGESLEDDDELD